MIVGIDKPKGITSHDVIDVVRRISGIKRVGHAGTLDPNATGLLIVGVGSQSTKKLSQISKNTKKEYLAEIFLGEERDTDDAEGCKISTLNNQLPCKNKYSKKQMLKTLERFVGSQQQVPPVYSAIRIKGKKAYQLARKGKEVLLKPREVVVYSIDVIDYKYPILKIQCLVSSGTYIRALARDIGRALGCGAYLKNLRRTKIGNYKIKDAIKVGDLSCADFQ